MNRVLVKNKTNKVVEIEDLFQTILIKTLAATKFGHSNVEANVIIIDDKEMKSIAKKYKESDKTTDVLSFSTDWKNLRHLIGYVMLGDIFLSLPQTKKQAKEYNHSLQRELAYLFCHGLLHLLGYDHITSDEEIIMSQIANKVMRLAKVSR